MEKMFVKNFYRMLFNVNKTTEIHIRNLYLAPPFIVDDYEPSFHNWVRCNQLEKKVLEAVDALKSCKLCPRNCGVNRLKDVKGACNTGRKAIVSSAFPHFGEESVLQGWNGSGTIFFGMCNLRCVFCQNWDISQRKSGWLLDAKEIADLMLKLQNETKCHNINFVTPEHVVPQVIEAIHEASKMNFNLPIVYNTSSYDSAESLKYLEGLIDIYMPDFKFWKPETAQRLSKARDYPEVTKATIKEMYRQVGDLIFDGNGLAKKGLIIRHLVMPNQIEESKSIMKWIAEEISTDTYVNIMSQYRPTFQVGKGEFRPRHGFTKYEDIDRPVHDEEIEKVQAFATKCGLWRFEDNIWLQNPVR